MAALERSAIVASISSIVAVALGYSRRSRSSAGAFRGKAAASAPFFSPLVVPYVVFGISLLVPFAFVDKVLIEATASTSAWPHSVVVGHVVVSRRAIMILTIMPLLND